MTAIEFFRRIDEVERSVHAAARKVELFKSMAEKITMSLEGEVVSHSPNVHSNEDAIIRLSEAKEDLRNLTDAYTSMVDMITEKMTRLDDPEEESLLTYHYLHHISLSTVAIQLHRGRTWVYRRHDIALEKLNKILADLKTDDLPA